MTYIPTLLAYNLPCCGRDALPRVRSGLVAQERDPPMFAFGRNKCDPPMFAFGRNKCDPPMFAFGRNKCDPPMSAFGRARVRPSRVHTTNYHLKPITYHLKPITP